MAPAVDHEQVRNAEDRSSTFALLDAVRAPLTSEAERAEAFRTLAFLEDHRSIEPLTAIVENRELAPPVRAAASEVLSGFDDRTTRARSIDSSAHPMDHVLSRCGRWATTTHRRAAVGRRSFRRTVREHMFVRAGRLLNCDSEEGR